MIQLADSSKKGLGGSLLFPSSLQFAPHLLFLPDNWFLSLILVPKWGGGIHVCHPVLTCAAVWL